MSDGRLDNRARTLRSSVKRLSPAYFGLVMSTGIVSIAAYLLGLRTIAQGMFALNVVFYVGLWVLYAFLADLSDHLRGPGFFTVVAATALLGSQALRLADSLAAGFTLWVLTVLLWLALTYTIFTIFTVKECKPALGEGSMAAGCWRW